MSKQHKLFILTIILTKLFTFPKKTPATWNWNSKVPVETLDLMALHGSHADILKFYFLFIFSTPRLIIH